MRLVRALLLGILPVSSGLAQLPAYYEKVNRVIWVVENLDKVRRAWERLGLTDIQEYPNIRLVGEYRGQPITIHAWQITGRFGNLTVDMIQPGEGQANAYTGFLSKHGDGILAIVHEVRDREEMTREVARMKGLGVAVLQQVTVQGPRPVTFTYFDTEENGKFVLALAYREGGMPVAAGAAMVTHFSPVVWDASAVSDYWAKLGFPGFPMQRANPRPDSRYRGQPLALAFDVGYQRHTQFRYEWISPPPAPPNIYADFLNRHRREGIQHIGVAVADLARSIADYEKLGYRVHQAGAWGDVGKPGSGQYAYMDTDSSGGVCVELLHSY